MANASIAFDDFEDKETGEKISLAEIMKLPSIVAQAGVTLADYDALKATDSRSTVLVGGRNTRGDVGGGVFSFIEGDQSTNVSGDTGEGIWVAPASDPSGASGAWIRHIEDHVDSRWYRFTGDADNDTTAAQQMLFHSEYFNVSARFHGEIVRPLTVGACPSVTGKLVAAPKIPQKYNQYLLDCTSDGTHVDVELDLSRNKLSGLQVRSNCAGSVYVHNQGAGFQADAGLQNAVYLAGQGNEFDTIRVWNVDSGVDSNDSIPRCLATSDNNIIHYLEMVDCNSGYISTQKGVQIDSIYARNVRDNPIYCLGPRVNSYLSVGTMTCIDCPDEPIVVSHGGYMTVSSLSLYNSGRVNVQGSELLIGSMFVDHPNAALSDGRDTGTLIGVRKRQDGDPDKSKVHVGSLSGRIRMTKNGSGACIYGVHPDERCDAYFGSVNLEISMVSGPNVSLIDAVRGSMVIDNLSLKVVDPNGVITSDPLYVRWPQENRTYDGKNSLGSVCIYNYTSADIRLQHLIGNINTVTVPQNLYVNYNVGPYATFPPQRSSSDRQRIIMQVDAKPTAPGFIRGDIALNRYPSDGGNAGWTFTGSAWRSFGVIESPSV